MEELRQYKNGEETRQTERQVGDQLAIRGNWPQCPGCGLILDPFLNCAMTYDGVCPRCTYDLARTIELSSALSDPETLKQWAGLREFHVLVKILDNWLAGYLGLVARRGVDWSMPHEFFEEFSEFMYPYIARLKETGYATADRLSLMGDKVTSACQVIINACQQEEDLMRLCGSWTDQEEEIKNYWIGELKRLGGNNNASLRIQM